MGESRALVNDDGDGNDALSASHGSDRMMEQAV